MRIIKIVLLCLVVLMTRTLQAAPEKVLKIFIPSEPDSLDPALNSTIDGHNNLLQLFEGVVSLHPTENKILPGVAERWEMSKDGKTYTFYLRKDAKWSDGSPVTAKDFIYAWRRAIDPKTGSPQATRLQYIKNGKAFFEGKIKDPNLLGFREIDAHTIKVELEGAFPPFLELLTTPTFAPVRQEVVEKYGDQWVKPAHIVSNGPFLLQEHIFYSKLIFAKNPHYWDKNNVHLDKIVGIIIEDHDTALKRYFSGDIDFIYRLPAGKIASLRKNPDFHAASGFGLYYYIFNTKHPVLKDPRVRKALGLAIDRNTITKRVLQNDDAPATTMIPPGVNGYDYPKGIVRFDPKEAKNLMAEAGYPDGKGFPTLTLSYNTVEEHKVIAETVQQMWKNYLGIDVKLENQEWKSYIAKVQNHKFDIARMGGIGEYIYPTTFLEGNIVDAPGNYSQWTNPKYDQLWEEAKRESDPKKQLGKYMELEKMFLNEMPETPIYFYANYWLVKPHVKGLHLKPLRNFILKSVKVE